VRFSEKLDFLMNITKTSNSALARFVALDASYISRLRSGKRLLPKDDGVIRSMGAYFARRCAEAYQQKAITDALKSVGYPDADIKLPEGIARWLLQEGESGAERVDIFLDSLSGLADRAMPLRPPESDNLLFSRDDIAIHYGIQGKRQAVLHFLAEVASRERPQTLLLYSDEATSWMTGDPAFAQKLEALMLRVLAQGNRIKIIHNISRDLDEMLSAISQWMPLYMSGLVEPYFYPKKRDGIFKRTLFIAPETAAVVSNSVGDMIERAANVLFRDRAAVASFAVEFTQYLCLCRPLMRILTARDKEAYYATLAEFEQEKADTIIKTESLSPLTMPEALLLQILQRAGTDDRSFLEICQSRSRSFQKTVQANRLTEIISLPDAEAVKKGEVKVGMSDMLKGGAVYYTPEEYIRHLTHIIELLKTYERFHIQLVKRPTEDRYMVYAREELGVIVAKTSQPPVVLAINESNMTAAFWDFLKDIIGEKDYDNPNNGVSVSCLQSYIEKLKD
jgi:hypothetical protein